jgi:sugar lactone lactonase YvrE
MTDSTGKRRVIHDFGVSRGGDGMCLDNRGNLYMTARLTESSVGERAGQGRRLHIFSRGEADRRNSRLGRYGNQLHIRRSGLETLYITAGKTMFRIRMNITGYLLWPKAK